MFFEDFLAAEEEETNSFYFGTHFHECAAFAISYECTRLVFYRMVNLCILRRYIPGLVASS